MIRKIFIAVIAICAAIYAATLIFPKQSAGIMVAGLTWASGLEARVTDTPSGTVHYYEGGEGETVVFLHGIFARKEHWIDLSRALTDGYRVILLDLPGFGENDVLPTGSYDFGTQAKNFAGVLDALKLDGVHLAANSMGAQLAAMIAIEQPGRFKSISFIGSPVGVNSPTASDMEKALAEGYAPLVVANAQDYEARMAWLFPDPPYIPAPVANTWANEEIARATDNARIWDEVAASSVTMLEGLAPGLDLPTLIVWCNQDRIFHISGADVLGDALPNATVSKLDGCGHLPMLDAPKNTGIALRAFLDSL